ncbi:hypothetical protein PPACK8108_LOCUS13377 [Phakopsora pachyrhizi]|uniref:Retroviral polymerase SH3-like domain-containing protein n=1 Tax=Phakopsora pachyrhizi TaxID=170000 RepID=A0AAV0B325_PHAPC|nr:hypothetical protein PPACK8108_LOCUS13377 [Phakopsora pachyrhizi]
MSGYLILDLASTSSSSIVNPNLKRVKQFGCKAFFSDPKYKKKLDDCAKKGILVGYESEMGAYQIFLHHKNKITRPRDVRFDEDLLPLIDKEKNEAMVRATVAAGISSTVLNIKTVYLGLNSSSDLQSNDISKLQQQILELKLIVNQSNKDRMKVEQENQMLRNQIKELKQINQALENQVGQLIISKKSSNYPSAISSTDEEEVKEIYRLNCYLVKKVERLESKIKGLNWKVEEINKKRSKEVNSLNKEVSELESMIEGTIFKEEELESYGDDNQ